MIKVYQTIFGCGPELPKEEQGNCFAACVASILELSLEDVPNFVIFEDWWKHLDIFCDQHGREPIYVPVSTLRAMELRLERLEPFYYIGCGPSPRNLKYQHAVVCKQELIVHDPLPEAQHKGESVETLMDLVILSDKGSKQFKLHDMTKGPEPKP